VSWRLHSWFGRSKAMGKQADFAGIHALAQRLSFFDHAFSSGDSLRLWMTATLLGQTTLWVAFQCAFWHCLDCTSRRVRGWKGFGVNVRV